MSGEGLKINLIRIWWWTWCRCIVDRVFHCGAFSNREGVGSMRHGWRTYRCNVCLEPRGAMDHPYVCDWCGKGDPAKMDPAPEGCLHVNDGVRLEDRA